MVYRLREMAQTHKINIIGGSHVTRIASGHVRNIAYVALRDGTMHAQEKIHPTPDERSVWNVEGGDAIHLIENRSRARGSAHLLRQRVPGACPPCHRHGRAYSLRAVLHRHAPGHLRVRYCCQAGAVENQCYVVTAGNVGTLMGVENMELQYAQSAILTPSDHPFARDGIAAEASENVEWRSSPISIWGCSIGRARRVPCAIWATAGRTSTAACGRVRAETASGLGVHGPQPVRVEMLVVRQHGAVDRLRAF